jgi:hypothetical protein
MKYKAGEVTIDGAAKWAVVAGKKYFPHTLSDSKDEAHLWAIKQSAIWHAKQIRKLSDEFGFVEGASLDEWCHLS